MYPKQSAIVSWINYIIIRRRGMELNTTNLWFWLTTIPGIGTVKITSLLKQFSSVQEIFIATKQQLKQVGKLTDKDIMNIVDSRKEEVILKNFLMLQQKNVTFISYEDASYPMKLRDLVDPPYGLYVKGQLPKEHAISIAIVGARECSNYGKELASLFGRELSSRGVQIISGLARGIDACAHRGSLDGMGKTYAVLGSGVDRCYPVEHYPLYEKIIRTGGVLSECRMNEPPYAGNFPRRNRIISGLSNGILVIEARQKSGSFITVDQGLEQGKDIFVVPGRIYDEVSKGCNQLIKSGAEMVLSPEDILDYYHIKRDNGKKNGTKNFKFQNEDEEIVFGVLGREPKHINEIVVDTCFSVNKVTGTLLALELKGFIKQIVKNYYILADYT